MRERGHSPHIYRLGCQILVVILATASASSLALQWPQQLALDKALIILYQPQAESVSANRIEARTAFSLQVRDVEEPEFGVAWFSARLTTDRPTNLATFSQIKLNRISWPDSKDTEEQSLSMQIEQAMSDTVIDMKLSDLTASLAANQESRASLADIDNTPPHILFEQTLSILLLFDGEPRWSPVKGSRYERALNTAMIVVKDVREERFYLTDGVYWYRAKNAMGPWTQTANPPADLVRMLVDAIPGNAGASGRAPTVVTATEPTELIVSTGLPIWTSLDGGDLLYVRNTETPWIRDLHTGNVYVQLSGRWYRSSREEGPWTFVRADKLPESFSMIPPASDIGGVRSSVAGTPEAETAVADAQIPQTAAIKRNEANLIVEYDGKPKFETIAGTVVAYAVNTGAQVLEISGRYYAVDNGVWFIAEAPLGPWSVADSVPEQEIATIPPSAPVYNTTHVHIYETTPTIVYVGYTPGYLWSFNYFGVPIYGTGWYYPPYIGRFYFPRTPTWGFHAGYDPWFGWNYGVTWSTSFYRAGASWRGGWHHGYYPGVCCNGLYGGGYRHNEVTINTGKLRSARDRKNLQKHTNIYHNEANRVRIADQTRIQQNLKQSREIIDRKNNVYADQLGRVARHENDEWQLRKNGAWHAVGSHPEQRPAADIGRLPEHMLRPGAKPIPRPNSSSGTRPAVRPDSGLSKVYRSTPYPTAFNHDHMDRHYQSRQRTHTASSRGLR